MTRDELQKVRDWANIKVAGEEPPWAWYQYMKLQEALDFILAGMEPDRAIEEPKRPETYLRLVADEISLDTSSTQSH